MLSVHFENIGDLAVIECEGRVPRNEMREIEAVQSHQIGAGQTGAQLDARVRHCYGR
jgi:hypothetical protein